MLSKLSLAIMGLAYATSSAVSTNIPQIYETQDSIRLSAGNLDKDAHTGVPPKSLINYYMQ